MYNYYEGVYVHVYVYIYIYIYIYIYNHYECIYSMSGVFANGPGCRGSIPGRVIPKTQKNGA